MSEPSSDALPAGPYLIRPFLDQHRERSQQMILAAADGVGTGRVAVLGAGRATEIPLAELARRFDEVLLNDLDTAALEQGIRAAGLSVAERARIKLVPGDLTGIVDRLRPVAARLLDEGTSNPGSLGKAHDVPTAIRRLTELIGVEPQIQATLRGQPSLDGAQALFEQIGHCDLLVASCLISQLHAPAVQVAEETLLARFPDGLAAMRGDDDWKQSIKRLAAWTETEFMRRALLSLVPDGRFYLSETVQVCFTQVAADGDWLTPGTFRMTASQNLADYTPPPFEICDSGRWGWVAAVPQAGGPQGRIFDVQALVLKRGRD